MGGFNSEKNESMNDIEIISGTVNEKCANSVGPISNAFSARSGNNDPDSFKLSGHSGIFAKDAPRSQSFTSLMADLHPDINRVSSFSRCLNGTFP